MPPNPHSTRSLGWPGARQYSDYQRVVEGQEPQEREQEGPPGREPEEERQLDARRREPEARGQLVVVEGYRGGDGEEELEEPLGLIGGINATGRSWLYSILLKIVSLGIQACI